MIGDDLSLPRVKFLSSGVTKRMSPKVISDVYKGLKQSSLRQYESCGKDIQEYLLAQKVSLVTQLWLTQVILGLTLNWNTDAWTYLQVYSVFYSSC